MDLINKIIVLCKENFSESESLINDNKENSILDVLIATKLSQNTTDKTAYIAYMNLKRKYKNWGDLINEKLSNIKKEIKVCGMANTKARDLKNMLKGILEKYETLDLNFLKGYSSEEIYKELLQFKGIGLKTVSCVIAFALNRDVFPVDTHIHRVLNRLRIVNTNTPEKTFYEISSKIPDGEKLFLHKCLIRFGRNICKAQRPLCNICFLNGICKYENKTKNSKKNKNYIKENNFLILENV